MKKIKIKENLFEYKFNNPYVNNRESKCYLKCTRFFTRVYKTINKLKLDKLFEKNKKYKFLKECTFSGYDLENKKYKIDIDSELKLERLFIYDLLPKEYLELYEKNLIKLRKNSAPSIFKMAEFRFKKQFDKIKKSVFSKGSFLADNIKFSKNQKSFKFFDYMTIRLISISDSFFVVKYELVPNKNTHSIIENILKEDIYISPIIYTNKHWWRMKDIGGSSQCDNSAKKLTLENFILEMKYVFMKEINSILYSFIFQNQLVPPGIEVFSTNNFNEPQKDLLFLKMRDIDTHFYEKEKIYFMPMQNSIYNPNYLMDSIILVDEKDKLSNGEHKWYDEVFYNLSETYVLYYITNSLNIDISLRINEAQKKINTSIENGKSTPALMRLNRKIDKSLFYYKRLLNEINYDDKEIISELENFEKKYKKLKTETGIILGYNFNIVSSRNIYELKSYKNLLNKIYQFFVENLNSLYNHTTMKIALITLLLTAVSIILTLVTSNSEVSKNIINFIKSIF